MGFPIRKSADQRLFAPPHGLSQRTTSFIASQRQGIHRIPLRHLIALIINTHPSAEVIRLAPYAGVIERPFASNISENVAVKPHSQLEPVFSNDATINSPHECRQSTIRSINDRICFLFTMTDSNASGLPARNANSVSPRNCSSQSSAIRPSGGARRDRTDDLMLAKHALSQLSYGPVAMRRSLASACLGKTPLKWWAWEDLNFRPHAYQARALTN